VKFSLAIQAGGASSRMGRDKALLPFDGRPMAEHLLRRLGHLSDDVLVVSNRPECFAHLGVRVHTDVLPLRGALPGLVTAFTHARHDAVAVVACDMAFANPVMLRAQARLLESTGADAVVPRTQRGWEPFHGIYRRAGCLTAAMAALEEGKACAYSWYPSVHTVEFDEDLIRACDPAGRAFVNFNTPDEYETICGRALSDMRA